MNRKVLAFVSCILVLCSVLILPVGAVEVEPEEPIEPDDPYVDIAFFTASLGINTSGKATCSCFTTTAHSTYTIYLYMALYRYKDGYWQKVAGNWSGSGTGTASLYKQYYVTPGYYYCTGATATVRTPSGTYVESADIFSQSVYY